jgi:hypothetical protein
MWSAMDFACITTGGAILTSSWSNQGLSKFKLACTYADYWLPITPSKTSRHDGQRKRPIGPAAALEVI